MSKNPCSSILKLLKLGGIGFTAITPDNVAIIKEWLYYCIICTYQGFRRSKGAATFYGTNARGYFLDIWDICVFHVKCSSTCTPRDLVDSTRFIKTLSILRAGDRSNVPNLCLDPITINSVLDLLRVSLFATNQLLILMRS